MKISNTIGFAYLRFVRWGHLEAHIYYFNFKAKWLSVYGLYKKPEISHTISFMPNFVGV